MRLKQEQTFPPIALIFETREEAELFWEIILDTALEVSSMNKDKRCLVNQISDLFSNEANL